MKDAIELSRPLAEALAQDSPRINGAFAAGQTLAAGFRTHFASADREIRWTHAEQPLSTWLTPSLLLVGVVDARGVNGAGERFFGEWKTANPRERKTGKQVWRKNPQSLTYGVLVQSVDPDCHSFTVRKAFKSEPPTYDHAWYSYSDEELQVWRDELIDIGERIKFEKFRALNWKEVGWQAPPPHWALSFGSHGCFKYGLNYVCPFFEQGCDKGKWDFVPANALKIDGRLKTVPPNKREWVQGQVLLEQFKHPQSDIVVLSATAVDEWLRCRERFRRIYIDGIELPSNEAADIGTEFHGELGKHYGSLIAKEE